MNDERSFSSVQNFHTHTPCLWQGGVQCPGTGGENEDGKGDDDEMKAKMR